MVRFYLVVSMLGILFPYGAFIPWLVSNGLDISLLLNHAMVNSISRFAWLDVVFAAVALLGFIIVDGHKNKVRHRYIAVLGTLCVGVSCGLPLYLYLKEKQSLDPQPSKGVYG